MDLNEEGCNRLVNAIVFQAVKEYRNARRKLIKNPKHILAKKAVYENERFFKSDLFEELTGFNGKVILKKLQEEEIVDSKHAKVRNGKDV